MVMLSIAPINEIKLVAVVVLLAAALLTGPVTGLALGWRHGRLGKLAGLALGLSVGVLGIMVVVAEMVLTGPEEFAYSVAPAPEASGGEVLIKVLITAASGWVALPHRKPPTGRSGT